ncbi:hypothetical protein RRG08_057939 [Elysia crispata]|uniref:Uncharacterized protein n=1 Tax=Elysia crispata TaxID=231223 RepID=A0AAE0Y5N6_9GAST|nr:hypothetical protein RRG08_057939 [Elysia crispata]
MRLPYAQLLAQLSISDFLMGVYLIIIGSKNVHSGVERSYLQHCGMECRSHPDRRTSSAVDSALEPLLQQLGVPGSATAPGEAVWVAVLHCRVYRVQLPVVCVSGWVKWPYTARPRPIDAQLQFQPLT